MTEPNMDDEISPDSMPSKPDRCGPGAASCRLPIRARLGRVLLRLGLGLLLACAEVAVSQLHASPPAGSSPKLEGTAEHVRVMQVRRLGRSDTLLITLRIDPSYHVNANPASSDYLIPTSVAFDGISPDRVAYPQATPLKAGFADAPIEAYEGDIAIAASFPAGSLDRISGLGITVTAQACTEEICLPPADIPARAEW
jgi:hypothetical protein